MLIADLLNIVFDFAKGPSDAMQRCQAALKTYEKRLSFFGGTMFEWPPELGALLWVEEPEVDFAVLERSLLTQYFAECCKRYDRYGCEWCPQNMHRHTNLIYEFHLTTMGHDDFVYTLCSYPVFGHLDDIINSL